MLMQKLGIRILIIITFISCIVFADKKDNYLRWLESDNYTIRKQGAKGLKEFKDKNIIERLIGLLQKEKYEDVKIAIILTLADSKDEKVVNIFLENLQKETNVNIRIEIFKGLSNFKTKKNLEFLLKALKEEQVYGVKPVIVNVIGEYKDKDTLETLIYQFTDINDNVHIEVLKALEKIGENDIYPYVVYFLESLYESRSSNEIDITKRIQALTTLEKLGDKKSVEILKRLSSLEKNENVKKKYIDVIEVLKKR